MTWKLLNGDSAEILKTLDAGIIDLTVTSPPYDNLRTYNGFTFDFETIAQELYRVTKPGGVVVWVVGDATINGSETGTSFRQALRFMEIGFNLHDTMIYAKENPVPLTHNRYEQQFEYMFVFVKGKPATFNPMVKPNKAAGNISGGTFRHRGTALEPKHKKERTKEYGYKNNIWFYFVGYGKTSTDDIFEHPATFPEKLAHDHIISWSNKGDLILDPFAGSDTTLKMAESLGRDSIGIEISAEYCEIIKKRMSNRQSTLFEMDGIT